MVQLSFVPFLSSRVQFCQIFENLAGDTYEGDWVEGAMEGKGVMRYADGDIYEVETISSDPRSLKKVSFQGRWKCGLRDGMGEIVFQNGDYYRGHWTNDNMTDGFGKFTCKRRRSIFLFNSYLSLPPQKSTASYFSFIDRSRWHRLLGGDHRGEHGMFTSPNKSPKNDQKREN